MSAIGRAAALPPEPLISTLFGGRAAARPIAEMYEDQRTFYACYITGIFQTQRGWGQLYTSHCSGAIFIRFVLTLFFDSK